MISYQPRRSEMGAQYKVVPFIAKVKSGASTSEVAAQLEAIINQTTVGGWEFHSFNDVNIEVSPGCLAGLLLGRKSTYVKFDQLVFKKIS
jgi:hypothetical protein